MKRKPDPLMIKNKKITDNYLIQRIERKSKRNPTNSFGAGGPRGCLTKLADKKIREKSCFGYMGSAEFETGKIPESLDRMRDCHKNGDELKITKILAGSVDVYILSNQSLISEATRSVISLKKSDKQTRDLIYFSDVKSNKDIIRNTVGWFHVGYCYYPYMFFVSKSMALFYQKLLTTFKGNFNENSRKKSI